MNKRLPLTAFALACSLPAGAATSDYDHLIARVSHSCDSPYSIKVTLTNPGHTDIEMPQGSLPWSANPERIRLRGYEVQPGQPARRLNDIRIIADYFGMQGESIPAGASQSGVVDLRPAFEYVGFDDLGKIPVLIKIDFPMPRTYPGPPRSERRIHNVVVHGPSIELYVPRQRWLGTPCPVFTVSRTSFAE